MRTVPPEDIRLPKFIRYKYKNPGYAVSWDDKYPHAIICNCGTMIHFKTKTNEPVKIVCPECRFETVYY